MSTPAILVTHPTEANINLVQVISDETPLLAGANDANHTQPYTNPSNYDHERHGDSTEVELFCCRSSAPSAFYYRIRLLTFIVFAVTGSSVFIYLLLHDLNSSLQTVAKTEVTSFTLLGLSSQGVDTHIVGTIHIDYDNIQNSAVQRTSFKFITSWLIGGLVTVVPKEPIELYMRPQKEKDFFDFIHVNAPALPVDVQHNHTTEINLITLSQVTGQNFGKLYKYMVLEEIDEFELRAKFHADFATRWFTIPNYFVEIQTHVVINRNELLPTLNGVENFHIGQSKDIQQKLMYSSDILIAHKLPLRYTIDPLKMTLFTKSCRGDELVPIGDFITNQIVIESKHNIDISIVGSVDNIEDCSEANGGINKLIKDFLQGKTIEIFVGNIEPTSSLDSNFKLPMWVIELLQSIHFPVKVNKDMVGINFELGKDLFHNITVSSVTATESHLKPNDFDFTSDILMIVKLSKIIQDIDFEVPYFVGDAEILHQDKKIVDLRSNESQVHFLEITRIDRETAWANFTINLLGVSVYEGIEELVNKYLKNSTDEISIAINTKNLDFKVEVPPVVSTTLHSLSLQGLEYSFSPEGIKMHDMMKYLDKFAISGILIVESIPEQLDIMLDIDIKLSEDFVGEFSFDFDLSKIKYNIYTQNKKISKFEISDLSEIGNSMSFPLGVSIYQNEDNGVELQDMISKFISGRASDLIRLDVLDGDVVSRRSHNIGKMLSRLELHNISIPDIEFRRDEGNDEQVAIASSPFLIDASIYILTSEMEVTVYNPVRNCNVYIELISAQATYQGSNLGHVSRHTIDVTPGVFTLQRIPFTVDNGVGGDLLRKALNNQLDIEIRAIFDVKLKGQEFDSLELMYKGTGLRTNIKL